MFARMVLTLVAGCLLLAESSTGKTTDTSCLNTVISNNGDWTKFSFEVNHPAVMLKHCQSAPGVKESWTIEALGSESSVGNQNVNAGSILNSDGKDMTNTEWEEKVHLLMETVAKLEQKIEQITPSTNKKVDGYKKVGSLSGMYKMHTKGMVWLQAKRMCEQEGSHLLIINSAEEKNVVPALFSQNPNIQDSDWSDWAWIGVHDSMTEGDFWTVTGKRLSSIGYSYWYSGRPVLNTKENCVSVDGTGAMYDSECDKTAPFICEM